MIFSVSVTFFGDGTDKQADKQTDIGTDRLFLENIILDVTRKYPLCGYILCVLTHTTAWDQLWGGDENI